MRVGILQEWMKLVAEISDNIYKKSSKLMMKLARGLTAINYHIEHVLVEETLKTISTASSIGISKQAFAFEDD